VQLIAIDGPGGSGKSTVSKALAKRLGLERLDTGAMYRSVALLALRKQVDLGNEAELAKLARGMDLEVAEAITLSGEDVSELIRGPEIDNAVSLVATKAAVREELVRRQRDWASSRAGGVVEGRDIATVVFPNATLKVYLTASTAERARRRTKERFADSQIDEVDLSSTQESINARDKIDATREVSPLTIADDAVVIDSTGLNIDQVVQKIVDLL
jgi:cytidylate kinase